MCRVEYDALSNNVDETARRLMEELAECCDTTLPPAAAPPRFALFVDREGTRLALETDVCVHDSTLRLRRDYRDVGRKRRSSQCTAGLPIRRPHAMTMTPTAATMMAMLAAYQQARALGIDWCIVGLEHHWEHLQVALDRVRDSSNASSIVPACACSPKRDRHRSADRRIIFFGAMIRRTRHRRCWSKNRDGRGSH